MRIRDWSSDVCSSDLKSAEILQHGILHIPYLEPRGAVSAQVTMNGQTIRVFGMHLDLSGLWRRRQAAAIIAYAGQQEGMPTVLMGDLNEWSAQGGRSEEHTSELQSLMRISYAVFCLKKKKIQI